MLRALQVGRYLAAAILGLSLLLLLVGLGMAARPEIFVALWPRDPAKTGLVVTLVSGLAAIGSALLARVLELLISTYSNQL